MYSKSIIKLVLITIIYYRSHLLSLPQFDMALAQSMESGSAMATMFAMQLVQLYLVDERQTTHVTESDLFNTIEVVVRMAHHRAPPEGLVSFFISLIDLILEFAS